MINTINSINTKTIIDRDKSLKLIQNKEEALKLLKKKSTGMILKNFSEDLRDDYDIVNMAVMKDGLSLRFASERLRNDKSIVKNAMTTKENAFQFMGDDLKKNRDFILSVIVPNLYFDKQYTFCAPELQHDKSFAKDYLAVNAFAFKYLPEELKKDKELALIAVNTNSYCYKSLGEYRQDKDIIEIALNDYSNIKHLPKKSREDKDLMLKVIKRVDHNDYLCDLSYMAESLKDSREFWTEALKSNSYIFRFASDRVKEDCELLEKSVKGLGYKIEHSYTNSKELLTPIIQVHPTFFNLAPDYLRNDRELVLDVLKRDTKSIRYASEEIKNMLGTNESKYIERLNFIINAEKLSDKLDSGLESKTENLHKRKFRFF